ncbi:nucleotide exchange factor GrpE [Candidatus Daviesbacteria bacterium]|nr:nucleotide exchange factor GrpE [Candidatus Daviesbacteria bacterium]
MTKKADKVQELEIKVNELEAQLKRAVADYHNLEKRVQEGRSELTRWGTGELLVKILPVLDHLDKALAGAAGDEKQNGWYQGVELAVKELQSVLQSEGLSQIAADPSTSSGQGVQFDPNLHEAVDTREGDDNIILEVVRKGYTLNGKVLRPAAVVVGRSNVTLGSEATPKAGEATPESEDSGQARLVSDESERARMTEEEKGEMSS